MVDTYEAQATDFVPDPHNANAGTERGQYMLDESVQRNGLGRSIVVSSDGVVIAGNKTLQAAIDAGLIKARVVETDGHELVVVKRADIESGTAEFADLALADNRSSEVGLEWDVDALEWAAGLTDLETWFRTDELQELGLEWGDGEPIVPEPSEQAEPHLDSECFVGIYCSSADLEDFQNVLSEWAERDGVTINVS